MPLSFQKEKGVLIGIYIYFVFALGRKAVSKKFETFKLIFMLEFLFAQCACVKFSLWSPYMYCRY